MFQTEQCKKEYNKKECIKIGNYNQNNYIETFFNTLLFE